MGSVTSDVQLLSVQYSQNEICQLYSTANVF